MKKYFIACLMFFAVAIAKAQTGAPDTTHQTVRVMVEQEASFPGGTNKLFSYIKHSLIYPSESKDKGIEGVVLISFIVAKDGHLQDIKVDKSVAPDLDAEAVRIIKNSPVWMPAMQSNKPVPESFKVPVTFKLN